MHPGRRRFRVGTWQLRLEAPVPAATPRPLPCISRVISVFLNLSPVRYRLRNLPWCSTFLSNPLLYQEWIPLRGTPSAGRPII